MLLQRCRIPSVELEPVLISQSEKDGWFLMKTEIYHRDKCIQKYLKLQT
jgi:hypothetical protein